MSRNLLISLCSFALAACAAPSARAPNANPSAIEAEAAATAPAVVTVPEPQFAFVLKQLKLGGFSPAFIKEIEKVYDPKGFEEVVRLNVLLYLRKADVHGPQVTDQAVAEAAAFAKENKDVLARAEKTYGVSGKVIASLLWMESRYGKNLGRFHVPSVFIDLVQAPRKDVQNYLLTQTGRYTEQITAKQKREILERTHKKAKFALHELHALERAFKWHWKLDESFRGSYSGAFGMPQFLPSSYIAYARAVTPKKQPLLDHADDAILSVAYYLKKNGWRAKSQASHIKSMLSYNNSTDYVNAILSLSEKI